MKKKLTGVFAVLITVLIFMGFKNKPEKTVAQQPATVDKTLDGFDANTAKDMIDTFKKYYIFDPKSKSVTAWYSKAELIKMHNVLHSEAKSAVHPADGVRIYFGSDVPDANKHLKPKIFLVTTSTKDVAPTNGDSPHGDYYTHDAGLFNYRQTVDLDDDNAQSAVVKGARLYDIKQPGDGDCSQRLYHFVPGDDAYAWVRKRCEYQSVSNVDSGYNTRSEWLPLCFIDSLFSAIINEKNNNLDGMRIYLGRGNPRGYTNKDVFILVPTQTVTTGGSTSHVDFYNCLEDMGYDLSCYGLNLPDFDQVRKTLVAPQFAKPMKLSKQQLKYKKLIMKFAPLFYGGGGYDNGELCPNSCN